MKRYKRAWEELSERLDGYFELEFADTSVQSYMKELEHKHDIIKVYETYVSTEDDKVIMNALKELDFIKIQYDELVQMHPVIAESTAVYIRFESDIELGERFLQDIRQYTKVEGFDFEELKYED